MAAPVNAGTILAGSAGPQIRQRIRRIERRQALRDLALILPLVAFLLVIFEAPIASHNLLRAHGAGMLAIRAESSSDAGLVVNIEPKVAATDHPDDVQYTEAFATHISALFANGACESTWHRVASRSLFRAWAFILSRPATRGAVRF